MPPTQSNPETRQGFTLTELAIVLGVLGAVLGAIWVGSAAVISHNKINKAQQELITIVGNIRSLYVGRSSFAAGGLSTSASLAQAQAGAAALTTGLINAGVFPSDMLDNTTAPPTVMSPWGTQVTVNLGTAGNQTPDGSHFWVDFASFVNNLPAGVCANFDSQIASLQNIGLIQVWDGVEYVAASANADATSFINCNGGASFQFSLTQ